MIGIQEQKKQNNVLNRSQRRTPLNVVVEKIGSASAVVHGDLSKETLKELLMSELSLISKVQSAETKNFMALSEKKSLTHGDKENISKKYKAQEEGRELKTDKESKSEDNRNISDEDPLYNKKYMKEGDKKENIEKDFGKGAKTEEVETKDGKKDKESRIGEKQNEDKEKERQGKIGEDKSIAKKSDENYQNEETENVKKDSKEKRTNPETIKIDLDRKSKNEYADQEKTTERDKIFTSQQKKDTLQEKEKMKTDPTVKYLFRKKDLKTAGKAIISGKGNREIGRFSKKAKNSKKNGHFEIRNQIEEILDDKDFTEDYEKEDRESCFSKISSDKDMLTLSYDGKWLKQYLKKPLILAMNEIVEKKPKDPVNYLGFWLLNYKSCQENLQRQKSLETELLSIRNERNMLHAEAKKTPELIVEEEASKHSGEGENIEDLNFSSYEFR